MCFMKIIYRILIIIMSLILFYLLSTPIDDLMDSLMYKINLLNPSSKFLTDDWLHNTLGIYNHYLVITLFVIPFSFINCRFVHSKVISTKLGFLISYLIFWVFSYYLLVFDNHLFNVLKFNYLSDLWFGINWKNVFTYVYLILIPSIYLVVSMKDSIVSKIDIGKLLLTCVSLLILFEFPYYPVYLCMVPILYFFVRHPNEKMDRYEGLSLVLLFMFILLIAVSRWFIILIWIIALIRYMKFKQLGLMRYGLPYLILPTVLVIYEKFPYLIPFL